MATGASKVTYEGQIVTVSSVTLVDTSGNSRKYQIYFICVGAGLGLLVFILIVCCCLKNGKSKLKRANKNSVHGVTNRAMNVKHYQDKKHEASFTIERNDSSSCMIAIFVYKTEEYVMRPKHCLFDVGRNMNYRIAKMDVRYKNIQSSYTITILYSGIYIADTQSKAQFVENNKLVSSDGTQVSSSVALDAVTAWINNSKGIPEHDHAMLFTRYDLTSGGSSSNAGLAYLSGMCSDKSVSVAEDQFDFTVLTTAAHELGHGLSAEHDGTGNSCNSADSYIMAAVAGPVQNQNPWKFSTCSVNYFTTFINKLNQTYIIEIFRLFALNCGVENRMEVVCVAVLFLWCLSGECKYDECAPPGDETCLYGDAQGVVFTYNTNEITCSFEDIKNAPSVCYYVKDKCCLQRRHFYTGIVGCEYGDKETGCSNNFCWSYPPSQCCGTCYTGLTLTTPSQEPTTTEYKNPCKSSLTTATPTPSVSTTSTTTSPPSSTFTTTTPKSSSYVFRLTVTFMIDITDDLSNNAVKESVISKVQAALISFYQNSGLKFVSCIVRNIRKGSLNVDYEVYTAMNSQVVADVTFLSKDMVTGKSKVTYEGHEVTVSSVTLVDTSGNSLSVGNNTSACDFLKQLSECPSGHVCEESNNGPMCRNIAEESFFDKYQYFIYAGACAILLVFLFIVCVCCRRKKRRSTPKSTNKNPLHGITNYAMNVKYYQDQKHSASFMIETNYSSSCMIDVRYKSIQSWFTISILYSGIYIADAPEKAQFIENNKDTSSSQTMADSTVVLNAVTSWINGMSGIPPHDHAMMFTSWYIRSQATTASGKDKEAKNSIIQFYSFVVNGGVSMETELLVVIFLFVRIIIPFAVEHVIVVQH
uniref:ADAM family mig-17 n=1 Tax=Magallana gigas TaxID=29159 RepID=K1QQE9_MAGGI